MQGALAKLSGAKNIVLATPVKDEQPISPAIYMQLNYVA